MDVKENSYRKKMLLGQDGNNLMQLLVINAVAFVILKFIFVVYVTTDIQIAKYYDNIFRWVALPADAHRLIGRPWTVLTYLFADDNLLRFIANLFWLWSFGYILQDLTGNRKLIPVYLYGGLTGAALYVAAHYIFPAAQPRIPLDFLSGASCGILAVAVATTTVSANYRIFPMIGGGIPLWVLTVAYLLLSFSAIGLGDIATYCAEAGAAGIGFLFIFEMRRGRDWSAWMNAFFDRVTNLFNPDARRPKKKKKDEFFYNVSGTQPYRKIPNITQKRIDEILDKINQQGYRFLTSEEKEILRRAAEEEEF